MYPITRLKTLKIVLLTRKPRIQVRISIYRTWPIAHAHYTWRIYETFSNFDLFNDNFWVYLGVRTCEVFLCFVAIVRVRVYYIDFFVFFVLRHW